MNASNHDIFGRGHRQQMGVMEAVYPITALYLGPLALVLYWRWGRNTPDRRRDQSLRAGRLRCTK
jgi:hypothetical protein